MAKGKTKGKTNTTANMVVMPPEIAANQGAAIHWAKTTMGLPHFSQLVIGEGPNPTFQPKLDEAAGRRKVVLQNNAMVGQTVAEYYKAAKAHTGDPTSINANNPLQAVKVGLITLLAPAKS